MTLKEQVESSLHSIVTDEIRIIITDGIRRGLDIHQAGLQEDRERLGFYAKNQHTRDIFSSFCRGLELSIHESPNLLLTSTQCQVTSSYFIEITNPNLIIHVYNEASAFPNYMKEKCKLNTTFQDGKQNYCAISYCGQNGNVISSVDIVVFDVDGKEIHRERLHSTLVDLMVA